MFKGNKYQMSKHAPFGSIRLSRNRKFRGIVKILVIPLLAVILLHYLSANPMRIIAKKPTRIVMLSRNLLASRFINAYPNFIVGFKNNYILYKDGSKEIFSEKRQRYFKELLKKPNLIRDLRNSVKQKYLKELAKNSDLEDTVIQRYPIGNGSFKPPAYMHDPGILVNYELLKKMYGSTKRQVEKNLVYIKWMPKTVNKTIRVTKVNGVDKKLTAISYELDNLPEKMKKYVTRLGGTFKWRYIDGTHRLSTHAFGIAIDIKLKYSNYWVWRKSLKLKYKYENRIPKQIVEIFEKHGFIWGGKWYDYDTMHFEYRPELLNYHSQIR